MRSLLFRVTAAVWCACVGFAVVAAVIGTVGLVAVRSATATGKSIAGDELTTAIATARFDHDVQQAGATGQALGFTAAGSARTQLRQALLGAQIPAVDADLGALQRIHATDGEVEWAGIILLSKQWAVARTQLTLMASAPSGQPGASAPVAAAFGPLHAHVESLADRELTDARDNQATAGSLSDRLSWAIVAAVLLFVLGAGITGWAGNRFLHRVLEPAQDQVEFADTLQLAEDEGEAHGLLRAHLERGVIDAAVVVLNRNNSADRLEAVTAVPPDSPLTETLRHAEPRSCLAVRSGRVHDDGDQLRTLLGCAVCATCPGRSTCTPLTVGGEVIGSVLVSRPRAYNSAERLTIRDSVNQAAPVLANLRNLAIAELRAATDSLTGLPNKRAVADTVKRMLAQASRTLTPLCLLMLDLDHFRDINEHFGHPVGDQALANVGATLRMALRDSDFAGRNGGEEFVVILPDTDLSGGLRAAENIRASIAEITLPGVDLIITASVGLAVYPEHATSSERLERLADSALYVAKRSGRNRIEVAVPTTEGANPDGAAPSERHVNGAAPPGRGGSRPELAGAPPDPVR
jgi:diguanylate cyclase (GGDEF)-like protein